MRPSSEKAKSSSSHSRLKQFRRRITYAEGFINFFASLTTFIIILYFKTLKVRYYFHPEFRGLDRSQILFGVWHGRQFLFVPIMGPWRTAVMTDLSWAGEIQTRILSRLGYRIVRGSSRRKGAKALLHMKRLMENGCSGAFTLDGPKGPIYKSKPGIIYLAQKLSYPIVPLASTADRAWILKNTWCRYFLPKPFSRCLVAWGKPLWEATLKGRLMLEEVDCILVDWTNEIDHRIGRLPESDLVASC